MRRSELLALRSENVDFIFSQISVSRSLHHLKDGSYIFTEPKLARSRRTIALWPSATLLLRDHHEKQKLERARLDMLLKGDDLVFSQIDGKPLRPNTVTRAWTMLAARVGVKVIRLHDARHTHASLMLNHGVMVIHQLCWHKRASGAKRPVYLTPRDQWLILNYCSGQPRAQYTG